MRSKFNLTPGNVFSFKFTGQSIIVCFIVIMTLLLFADVEVTQRSSINARLASLEHNTGGRIGVYAINTDNNQHIEYHADERFPLCSTSKIMGVAAMLKKSETHLGLLETMLTYKKFDLVSWSPVTEKHLDSGMTLIELAKAAITRSDNTAINLIMKQVGGPEAVNAFAQSIGDDTFNLIRWEPELNTAIPGDLRDTSTPKAMANSLRRLVLGGELAPPQRNLLKTWLIENTTGNSRIRAAAPKGWVIGDKTGTCAYGTTNDIGIIWPPRGAPIVLAIYYTERQAEATSKDNVTASVSRIVLNAFLQPKATRFSNNGQTSASWTD